MTQYEEPDHCGSGLRFTLTVKISCNDHDTLDGTVEAVRETLQKHLACFNLSVEGKAKDPPEIDAIRKLMRERDEYKRRADRASHGILVPDWREMTPG